MKLNSKNNKYYKNSIENNLILHKHILWNLGKLLKLNHVENNLGLDYEKVEIYTLTKQLYTVATSA